MEIVETASTICTHTAQANTRDSVLCAVIMGCTSNDTAVVIKVTRAMASLSGFFR